MIRRALTAALLAATVAGFAPARALPVDTAPIRCIATDATPQCGYMAAGPARLWSFRAGPWVARVYRDHVLVWSVGGAFATTMVIPAEAGDRVQIALIKPVRGCDPVTEECGFGPVLGVEGGPEVPIV